jgi:hypothetical protein
VPATFARGWVVAHSVNHMITECLVDQRLLDAKETTNILDWVTKVPQNWDVGFEVLRYSAGGHCYE